MEGKSDTPPKAASQSIPRESTSAMSPSWEYGGGAIQEETVTSALNAHNQHPNHIYMDMTPEQCYLSHRNSQNIRRSGRWDMHSSIGMDD